MKLMPERLDNMEELACFSGGLVRFIVFHELLTRIEENNSYTNIYTQLALGAYTDPNGFQSARAQRDLATAKALTYTCYQMFERTGMLFSSLKYYKF